MKVKNCQKNVLEVFVLYIYFRLQTGCAHRQFAQLKKQNKNMDSVLSNVQITEDNIKPKPKSGRTSPYTH